MRIRAYPREFFIDRVWRYEGGEHVSFIGPTKAGKTHLAHQLLAATATAKRPVVDLVMKPRDKTTTHFAKAAGYRKVLEWDHARIQAANFWRNPKPSGYTVWPKHAFDPDVDDPVHSAIFRTAILDSYKRGKRILFADEVYS